MEHLWGIDLGGTKIEGVIFDPAAPDRPVCRLRVPTESANGYDHIRGQITKLVKMLCAESGLPRPNRIGMGTPGVVDPHTGKLKNSNTQCLNARQLREDLESDLGIKVVLANDANCFALAEATLGAARGFPTVFGVILGTGVGGSIVVDGHLLSGCHGIAGEWGQIVLDPNGPLSNYGTRGTVEALISGPGLERFYAEQSGHARKLKEIVARAQAQDDPAARATIDRLTDTFAKAIGLIIDVLDPHAIVLGGGVGNIEALYTVETRKKIAAAIFNPTFDAALLKPAMGDSAGVFGAAMLR
ncbi:MAG TPA: ROK family protein [Candidatus Methylacidiphilales bacterium]|jgi:predicted NBD/HSP70 family sugar kinase|nr:ROK family protein [Candidatus Methylacidiphilales bacterium]